MKTKSTIKQSFITTLALTTLITAVTTTANAAIVNWSRADVNASSDTRATEILTPTSGSLNSAGFTVGIGNTGGASGFYDYNNPNNANPNWSSPGFLTGEYVETATTFDHLFTGGTLNLIHAWQWNDYSIQVTGGNGVIDASAVQLLDTWNGTNPALGTDYTISGSGTDLVTFDAKTNDFSAFYGSITINGTWSGITIKQLHNSERTNNNTFLDVKAELEVSGIISADSIPEPSSTLLLGLGSLGLIMRRKR